MNTTHLSQVADSSQVAEWMSASGEFVLGFATLGLLVLAYFTTIAALKQHKQVAALNEFKAFMKYAGWVQREAGYMRVSTAVHDGSILSELLAIKVDERRRFLAILESLAILINSELVSEEIAYYSFATTVLGAFKHPNELWAGIIPKRDDKQRWALALDLVERFTLLDKSIKYRRCTARFGGAAPAG